MQRSFGKALWAGMLGCVVLAVPASAGTESSFTQNISDVVCINGAPVPNCDVITFNFKLHDECQGKSGGCGTFFLGGGKAGGLHDGTQTFTTNAQVKCNFGSDFELLTICENSIELNGAPVPIGCISNFNAGELQFQANSGNGTQPVSFSGTSAFGGVTLSNFTFSINDPINVNVQPNAQGAPELDPNVVAAPLALLLGSLLVFADRRKRA